MHYNKEKTSLLFKWKMYTSDMIIKKYDLKKSPNLLSMSLLIIRTKQIGLF